MTTPYELRRAADRLEQEQHDERDKREGEKFGELMKRTRGGDKVEMTERLDAMREAALMAPYVRSESLANTICHFVAYEAKLLAEELDGVERPWGKGGNS